ncbi:MAG: hypothetical protein GW836_01525 [Paraglaciecola sp.]|nr:hypothetical protein [Paraglaciecola sp.]
MQKLAGLLTQYNKVILLIFALLCGFFGWFVQDFRIDASAQTLLTKNNKLT